MIKRIQIKNFKCYGEPGVDFSLKRINFIFGDNSAGKSTFLQLVRMVLNHESDRIERDFSNYVFGGDVKREIKMRITAVGRKERDEAAVRSEIGKVIDDEATVKFFGGPLVMRGEECPVYDFRCANGHSGELQYVGFVRAEDYYAGRRDRICKAGSHEEYANEDEEFRTGMFLWIPHVIHAEAARPPERFSSVSQKTSLEPESLLESDAIEYVNGFFRELHVPYECVNMNTLRDVNFDVNVLRKNVGAGIDGLYETALKLYEWRNYKERILSIAEQLGAKGCQPRYTGHALLALEEPESHVNERQISPLMNFLFREANERANGQMVVECHSELMALKLKNFVRSGIIGLDDLAVFFAEKTSEGTIMHEIEMDAKGNFRTKWPNGGFFSERTKVIDEFFKTVPTK